MGFRPFVLRKIMAEVECIVLIMTVISVERALAKKFDEDGNEVFQKKQFEQRISNLIVNSQGNIDVSEAN